MQRHSAKYTFLLLMCEGFEAFASTLFYFLCVKFVLISRQFPRPFVLSLRQLKVAVASGLPRSPDLYFDDDELENHRMSAITFAVYGQRRHHFVNESVHIERPSHSHLFLTACEDQP